MSVLVSIVITTHGFGKDLPGIMNSLDCQRHYSKGVHSTAGHVVEWVAGDYLKPIDYPYEIIITCDGEFSGTTHTNYTNTGRIIENEKLGAPGHHTREPGIKASTGSWIVLTNSDNYFMSGWRSAIEPYLNNPKLGAIYYCGVNNLWRWSNRGKEGGVQLKRGFIDLSFFIVRTEIAKEVGFPFRSYEGDWDYIDGCLWVAKERGLAVRGLKQILSVHN